MAIAAASVAIMNIMKLKKLAHGYVGSVNMRNQPQQGLCFIK